MKKLLTMGIKKLFVSAMLVCMVTAIFAQRPEEPQFDPTQPPVHDPVVMQCDGVWYMFTTGYLISVLKSDDFVNWEFVGHALEEVPQWAVHLVKGYNGHTWAPDIQYKDGLYYLYYSCSTFGKNTSAIGVAVNKTLNPDSPDYKWIDKGLVVNSVAGRDDWNAIDPNVVFDEDGTAWLCFGSFWQGLKLTRLDDSLIRLADPQEWYPVCRRPEGTAEDTSETDTAIKADSRGKEYDPGNGAVEAPFIIHRNGFYYLFASFDLCCRGANSTYKVVVGRSEKVTGPYYDAQGRPMMQGGGTVVVKGNDRYPGVGHCAVVQKDGKDMLVCHAYDKERGYNSDLVIREISWQDGWPKVSL